MQEMALAFYTLIGLLELHWQMASSLIIAAVILYVGVITQKRSLKNGAAFTKAIGVGVVIGVLFVFILPSLTGSSMSQVTYMVDWIFLIAISAGYAGIAVILAFPAILLMQKKIA
jgi:hypothetical protein